MLIGQEVTVLGGGIGGLATACALAQRGAQVQVIEQAAELSEVGAGLQVSPNGAVVLRGLGVLEPLAALSRRSEGVTLCNSAGRPVLAMDLRARGPFLLCHRADLVAVLALRAAELGVRMRLGETVAAVEPEATLRFSTGATERVELLVGADGVRSKARAAVLPEQPPFFTGQVAWRAIVPVAKGTVHDGARVFMGAGRHLVAYPLRDGAMLNLVGVEERAAWAEEGWSHTESPERFRAAFAGFGGPVPDYLAAVQTTGIWGLFRHPVAERWHKGAVVLVGDAAHPTLPFLAQGANLALEDAWVLAACLDQAQVAGAGFTAYQLARHARVTRTIAAAQANARNYHLRNPLVRGVAHLGLRAIGAMAPDLMPGRFAWLYGHDVTA